MNALGFGSESCHAHRYASVSPPRWSPRGAPLILGLPLALLASCGGELGGLPLRDDGGNGVFAFPDLEMPGGSPLAECGMVERVATDEGGPCVIPACADLEDPDQKGVAGGDNAAGHGGVGMLAQALSLAGCRADDGQCLPVPYTGHKGGHCRHNTCADLHPSDNKFWDKLKGPAGTGNDAVVRGMCFDRVAEWKNDADFPGGYELGEAKTAHLRHSRNGGFRYCAETQKHILKAVFVTILKEARLAEQCRDKYTVVLGDRDLCDILVTKMQTVQVELDRVNMPGAMGPPRFWLASNTEPAPDVFDKDKKHVNWTSRPLLIEELKMAKENPLTPQEGADLERLLTDPKKVNFLYVEACDGYCP